MRYVIDELLGFMSSHQAFAVRQLLKEFPELKRVMEQRIQKKIDAIRMRDAAGLVEIANNEQVLVQDFIDEVGVIQVKNRLDI